MPLTQGRRLALLVALTWGCGPAPCASFVSIAGERVCLDVEGSAVSIGPGTLETRAGHWAGPFVCTEAGCEQREPPLPSDGEWECRDELGALVCRGGGAPAGVMAGPRDLGFDCAPLPDGREVCVALDVPLPHDTSRGWACSIVHEHGPLRRCVATEEAPALLADCRDEPCPEPLRCVEIAGQARCLPPARSASGCWIDADCGGGRCALGRCLD